MRFALLVFAACSHDLAREADAIATRNQPKLDALVVRIHGLQRDLRGERPGWENMLRIAELANDELGLPPFTQTVQAESQWRANPTTLLGMGTYVRKRSHEVSGTALQHLVDDERERYDRGIASVTTRIREVERWITASRM